MDEERGTELNKLQRLKPTHELLHFALLKCFKRLLLLSIKIWIILSTPSQARHPTMIACMQAFFSYNYE